MWYKDLEQISNKNEEEKKKLLNEDLTLNWETFEYKKYKKSKEEIKNLSELQHWALEKQPALDFIQKNILFLDSQLSSLSLEQFNQNFESIIDNFDAFGFRFLEKSFMLLKEKQYILSAAITVKIKNKNKNKK